MCVPWIRTSSEKQLGRHTRSLAIIAAHMCLAGSLSLSSIIATVCTPQSTIYIEYRLYDFLLVNSEPLLAVLDEVYMRYTHIIIFTIVFRQSEYIQHIGDFKGKKMIVR